MKVLLWAMYGDLFVSGARVLVTRTAKLLRERGIHTEIVYGETAELRDFDLVHSFQCSPAALRLCRQAGLPVVSSTIYHRKDYFPAEYSNGNQKHIWEWRSRMALVLMRSALNGRHIEKSLALTAPIQNMRASCEMADVLLTSSPSETRDLIKDMELTTPCHMVPNGVDPTVFCMDTMPAWEKRETVLFAGRFEPDKNQLGLIRAMKGNKIPVVLVGAPHRDHQNYYDQCRRESTHNITMLPPVEHQEDLLPLYAAARVHVLPSFFETTGLVSLEAALSGCNVVSTERGYAKDYLQDFAWYCDPSKPASIREAIEQAYCAGYRAELRERILNNFTWEHTAEATLSGYRQALSYSGHRDLSI